jgi:tRNA 2-thiouridine synthesizing protein B
MKDKNVFVLGSDLRARGIDDGKLIDGVKVVDYSGFVELAASNDRVQAWL